MVQVNKEKQIVVVTKKGNILRFNINDFRIRQRWSKGVPAIKMDNDDEVVGIASIDAEYERGTLTEEQKEMRRKYREKDKVAQEEKDRLLLGHIEKIDVALKSLVTGIRLRLGKTVRCNSCSQHHFCEDSVCEECPFCGSEEVEDA